jgi:hypothetical protein
MSFKKLLRSFAKLAFIVLAVIATQRFCRKQTDSFALHKIHSELVHNPKWETPPLTDDEMTNVRTVLNQPYSYLGKGAQCYVFVSQDNQHVIKFFRLYHLLPPFWTKLPLPSFLRSFALSKIAQKEGELDRDFISYKIAFEEMREETGVLYVHLNKTDTLHQKIEIIDKLNIKHTLNLDEMEFLVQKRADLVYPALEKMVVTEGFEAARASLTSLVDLLVVRCQRGIRDKDPDLNTNFGFIGHTPLQIDVGRYRKPEGESQGNVDRDEIIRITDNLNQWLRAKYPELSDHLEHEIASL